ncbi:hypothetical protein [Sphingomonas sp. PP-CC-3G-468]|uniref:hypothetical protein n=1 Tax=Sphingomonas sp. PP-CC-3G-468 TaxID=2135656 RepID=UPI00104FA365|nr:hypothetical protein [Sphingomonas sp. PP-CC-3G-468]TCM07513.1 hypothetical protein C8J41_103421 [Sphingomonas sp. PP-CC-3G-468]
MPEPRLTRTDVEIGRIYYGILIDRARSGQLLSYGELVAAAKTAHPDNEFVQRAIAVSAGRRLEAVRVFTKERGYPDITGLVVNGSTGEVGSAFGTDPVAGRAEIAAFDWSSVDDQFDDFVTHLRAKAPVKRRKVKLAEAKRLIWEFFEEHRLTLPPSLAFDRARLQEAVVDGQAVADAFEVVVSAMTAADEARHTPCEAPDSAVQTFARVSPETASPLPGLTPASANPYVGTGTFACMPLRGRDSSGDTTIPPSQPVPSGYPGSLDDAPAPSRYTDHLIALSAWPNCHATYMYSGSNGAPVLNLSLALDISNYDAQRNAIALARQDLATYWKLHFQLNQNYTDGGLPGVTGNAVTLSVRNSLSGTGEQELSDPQAQQVRDFVAACVVFLNTYVNDMTFAVAPQATLSLPVDMAAIAPENLIPLDVSLRLSRDAALLEPTVAVEPDALSVCSTIPPFANASDPTNSAYATFANALETCLQTAEWSMRTGVGKSTATERGSSPGDHLYAVRFGVTPDDGIHYDIAASPGYYAPLPVATSLESGTVTLAIYATGGTTTQRSATFVSVDLNLWFESCLAAIDKFLNAGYARLALILDPSNATTELDAILTARQTLAAAISATTSPILSSSPTDAATLIAARNVIEQQLLDTLAPAFTTGTVVVFGLSEVSGADVGGDTGRPSLYGQPAGLSTDTPATGKQNFTMSPATLPLASNAADAAPRLAFRLTAENVDAQSYLGLDLSYQITHVTSGRASVSGIADEVESHRLAFVNPLASIPLGTQHVPVVNRALPVPPTVHIQTATFGDGTGSTSGLSPQQLPMWNYACSYSHAAAAQDDVEVTITLNGLGASTSVNGVGGTAPLFAALADFVTNYPAISADLDTCLLHLDGQTQDATLIANANAAVAAFQTRATAVAIAYRETFRDDLAIAGSAMTIPVTFGVKLEPDGDGLALICIRDIRIAGLPATYVADSDTITNGTITLPAPVVDIRPDQYMATALQPPFGVVIAYGYLPLKRSSQSLTFADALSELKREISLSGLNVLLYNGATTALLTKRNAILTPNDQVGSVSTNPQFVYRTSAATFSDALLPRIEWLSHPLQQGAHSHGRSVTDCMAAFFADLFTGASGSLLLGMSGGYSFSVAPGLPALPRTYLPVSVLPRVEITIDPAGPPPEAIAVTEQMSDWFERTRPSTADGTMDFKLSLFSNSGNERLLLVIDDLYFATGQ